MLLSLVALSAFLAQAPRTSLRTIVTDLEISADALLMQDRGPSIQVPWTTDFSGTLFVWTKSTNLDLFVRVEDDRGKVLGEDDDSGGDRTPCLQLEVEPERRLVIRIAAQVGRVGCFALHLIRAPETERSRKAAAVARVELDELKELRKDKANLAARKTERLIRSLHEEVTSGSSYLASRVLYDCAYLARELGDTRSALTAFQTVEQLWSMIRPASHENLQRARWGLFKALHELGDLHGALSIGERVLASRWLPDDAPEMQKLREWFAYLMEELGDHQGARVLSEMVLRVYSRTLPDDHPTLQEARAIMGHRLASMGDHRGAITYFSKVLDVRSKSLPETDLDLQLTRFNLAVCLNAIGDLRAALDLQQQALAAYSRLLPEDSPEILRVELAIAGMLRTLGELERARSLGEKVLAARKRALPEGAPALQDARCGLAWTYMLLGSHDKARLLASQVVQGVIDALPRWSIEGSPAQLEARVMRTPGISDMLSLASGAGFTDPSPSLEREGFLLVESLRGIGLLAARFAIEVDAATSGARKRAAELSEELVRLVRSGAAPEEISAIRHERDASWRALITSVFTRYGKDLFVQPTTAAFARLLADKECIVSFRRYTSIEKDPADPRRLKEMDSLLAHVLETGGRLTRVELGAIEEIEASVERWRGALGVTTSARGVASTGVGPVAEEHAAGEELRRLVWDPLLAALGDSQHVVLALDDVLHLVPFDALPSGEGVLGDSITFEVRTSLQELLWKQRPSAASPHAFLALGGASFGEAAPVVDGPKDVSELADAPRRSELSGGYASLLRAGPNETGFLELPGTLREVDLLREIHTKAFGRKKDVFLLRGAGASREALEDLSPDARYVHIATHGWFAQDPNGSIPGHSVIDAKMNFGQAMSSDELTAGTSPMTLCGLALAGANLPPDAIGRVRGLVTAEEIANWDLSNCELVVLSACDTHVGVKQAGQGVASLQKAFHMAGARSAITSLWKVPDEITAELMVDFYRRLWLERKPKGQALREVKAALRSRGIPTRDWGAWVLTGPSK